MASPLRGNGAGIRALLDALAEGDPQDLLPLGELLQGLGRRAFGVLLFLATPASFIPGVAGLISSPIVVLVGLQLMLGRRRPWLPRWLAARGPHRDTIQRFDARFSPWLRRLERSIKPRWPALLDHRAATVYSGLLLILLGLLLGLPIPFTNALFGVLLLVFALAYLERDGLTLLVGWIAGTIAVAVFGVLSGSLAGLLADWTQRLF